MKKAFTLFLSTILILLAFAVPTSAAQVREINISKNQQTVKMPEYNFGIHFGAESDISANLVCNSSFENKEDSLNGWNVTGIDAQLTSDKPFSTSNKNALAVTVNGDGMLANIGKAGMCFEKDTAYDFSFYAYSLDFDGKISVYLDSPSNRQNIIELDTKALGSAWHQFGAVLTAVADEYGSLAIEFTGNGTLYIDIVRLIPENSYGYGEKAWKNTSINNTYYNMLDELKPSFATFDIFPDGTYEWESLIGAVEERSQGEIGVHEYMQLCSEAGIKAIPTLPDVSLLNDSEVEMYANSVADFIDYANGNATTTYLGALRSANGREKPFNIKSLGYRGDDDRLCTAVKALCKGIKIIRLDSKSDYGTDISSATKRAADIVSRDLSGKAVYIEFDISELFASSAKGSGMINTPVYYTFMLLSNCVGNECIAQTSDNGLYSLATVDSKSKVIYISLINSTGKKQRVNAVLEGYGINDASVISAEDAIPAYEDADINGDSVCVKLNNYDITVLMAAYDDGSAQAFYTLPDNLSVMPDSELNYKIIIPCTVIAVLLLGAIIIIFSRKKSNS